MATPTNATGWSELFSGNMITAVFTMYDATLAGWTIAILFIVYQFMLLVKTRNLPLAFVSGLIFASMYAVSVFVKTISIQVIFLILVFEVAGILYFWILK